MQPPLLTIVHQRTRTALGSDYQREVDLRTLFKLLSSNCVETVMALAQARHVIGCALQR